MKLVSTLAAQLFVVGSIASAAAASPGAGEPTLEEVRKLTERFRDVDTALAEGYLRDPFDLCDTAEMMGRPAADGAMGVHYFRPDLLGITAPPSPQADGSMELVAVENLVFAHAWSAAGNAERPTFHGVPYDSMKDDPTTATDEAHMFEPHFDRHVWIYRDNPNGVFAPFNPSVSCEHHHGPRNHHDAHATHAE